MATRRERVVLDLESNVAPGVLRDAAAVAALTRELKGLSGQSVSTARTTQAVSRDVDRISASSVKADRSINQLTGRLRLMADIAATLGPAVIPLGAVGIAGVAGLASQLGFAAIAGGVLLGSFSGLSDALKAMNEAGINPTQENLADLSEEMGKLSADSRGFVAELHGMIPALRALRTIGRESMIPGFSESLEDMDRILPRVARIMDAVGTGLGEIASDSTASLASGRWGDFFRFIATDAPPALADLARILGDVTHGMAEMWMAFDPLNDDFSTWMVGVADGFDEFATGLSQTQGYAEFVEYVRSSGPQVAEAVGSIASAFVQVAQAAAPLGGPALQALASVADVVAGIADSDLGTPIMVGVAALSLYNRALMATAALQKRVNAAEASAGGGGLFGFLGDRQAAQKSSLAAVKADVAALGTMWPSALAKTSAEQARMAATTKSLRSNLGSLSREAGRVAGPMAGMGLIASGAADGIGLTNTASLALMGSLTGGWGIAVGAATGLVLDMKSAQDQATDATERWHQLLGDGVTDIDAYRATLEQARDAADSGWNKFLDKIGGTTKANAAVKELEVGFARLNRAEQIAASNTAFRRSLEAETAVLRENVAAMQAKRDEALRSFSAQTNYAQSLLDSKRALGENGRAWNLNTEAGLANRRVVEQQASSWNELNRTQGQTPAQARRARQALIETAESLGATRAQARRYADELMDIPNDLKTKISLDVDTAAQKVRAFQAQLDSLRDGYVTVHVNRVGGDLPYLSGGLRHADGGTVPKTGLPYADRHLYMLADGEEIVSNRHGQADKNRAALKAANAGAKLAVVGYSNGGTSGSMVGPDGRTGVAVIGGVVQEQDTRFKTSREDRLAMLKLEKEIRELVRDLRATGKDSLKGVERRLALTELAQARRELQAAHQAPVLKRDETGLQRSIEVLTAELEANSATLTEATSTHQGWLEKMSATGQAAVAGFNTGLFERDSNIWAAAAAGGWSANVDRDIAGLNERDALIAQLEAAGLTGEALAAALAQGSNADLAGVLQRGEAAAMQKKFTERAALQASVAGHAGTAAFGREAAAAGAVVAALEAQVQGQTAELEEANVRLEAIQRAIEGQGPRVGAAAAEGIRQGGNRVARRRRRD